MPCLPRSTVPSLLASMLVLLAGPARPAQATALLPDSSAAARLEAANTAYEQGRYGRAVERYRALLDEGYASGALYYNLANAYVRLGRWGQAIRYYEKARPLLGSDPRLSHNLEQARRRAGVYPDALPPRGLAGAVEGWPALALLVAGLLCLLGGGAVAVAWTRPGTGPPGRHPAVWGPFAAGGLLVAVALGVSAVQAGQQRAVVIADRTPLHPAPSTDAPADTTLAEGTLLEVRRRQGGWAAVRGANGVDGWVPADGLGGI